ncbi:MAG: aspartyl protease family protein [Pyrinomonadaceae bacterium]
MKFADFRTKKSLSFHIRCSSQLLCACFLILCLSTLALAAVDVQQVDTESTKQIIKRAEKLIRKGELAEAEKILRRAMEQNPQESRAKLKLAYLLFKQKRLIDAYNLAFDVAKAEPKNAYAFAVLGMTLLDAGRFKEAEATLVTAVTLDKSESLAWLGLGLLDFYENRIFKSLENLRYADYLNSDEPDYIFARAQVSARAESYTEAAAAYRRFLEVSTQIDKDRRERIKGLIDFLEFLGNRSSLYDISGGRETVVKFKLVDDRPAVEIKINKTEEPLNFILDTGSGISVVSEKTAKKLNIKPVARGGSARGFGGDGKFEIVYGFLNRVSIGDVNIRNVPVYIRQFHSVNENVDGYIGLSLISKFLTTIDYGNTSFTLKKKNSVREEFNEKNALALPLRLTSAGFLSGEVQIEGVTNSLNFIVDTGASLSVISDDLAGSTQLRQFLINERIRVIGSAGETTEMPMFMLPRVTFGKNTRDSIKAIALDLDMINETSGFEQMGILGGNFLKNYRLTFDFQNSKVIFVPLKE